MTFEVTRVQSPIRLNWRQRFRIWRYRRWEKRHPREAAILDAANRASERAFFFGDDE